MSGDEKLSQENKPAELHIFDGDRTIFDLGDEYVIPLYQRAFAWGDKQLLQLIEDISDVAEDTKYYIGSLIVSKQSGKFEVVDGQQRLTSLYLLLHCLELVKKTNHGESVDKKTPALTFACREKSNYTIAKVRDLLCEKRSNFDLDRIEPNILRGLSILQRKINSPDFDKNAFIKKLAKVIIYRIEVPKNTDLNRYFEIMNTRGEQLEQHDILKATLMSNLEYKWEKELFAKVWEACSDMTGYVQMHFISNNNELRDAIFGLEWNHLPSNKWEDYKNIIKKETESVQTGHDIKVLTDINFKVTEEDGFNENKEPVRFESIIEFPFFLLHTLKVYINIYKVSHKNGLKIVDDLLDDKKLIDAFDRVMTYGVQGDLYIEKNKKLFVRNFMMCLLRTRYLFDNYIIKREFIKGSTEGEWSLKKLEVSGKNNNRKPYYRNSIIISSKQKESTNVPLTKSNIMIQSALRVSYTSPKVMHWITELLYWLSESDCEHYKDGGIAEFNIQAENIAINAVKNSFFSVPEKDRYALGVNTPHIVFNYLDYLLWKEDSNYYKDFCFEFRNSVEHWYPQHPSEGTFDKWEDGVDRFGNLCIIQRNVNSRFSNMSPEAKKSTFENMISKGSLKLRKMSDLTINKDRLAASYYWKEKACEVHEEEMIKKLKLACHLN